MKRCWIGVGLLVVLLGIGIFSTCRMQKAHEPMSQALKQACALAENGRWEDAVRSCAQARQEWEDSWGISASFADHEPMERINALFAQLEVSARYRDTLSYCLLCAELWEELEAMGEAHKFIWWNLL